jgi:hypothetical protein
MMPKGHKAKHGYATVTGNGLGFREISERMTADGDEMNHATARNVLIRGLIKLATPLCKLHGVSAAELEAEAIKTAVDPRFQAAVGDILALKRS